MKIDGYTLKSNDIFCKILNFRNLGSKSVQFFLFAVADYFMNGHHGTIAAKNFIGIKGKTAE